MRRTLHRNESTGRSGLRRVAVALGLGIAFLLPTVASATAAGAADAAPQLSIAVDNGQRSAEVGDKLDFTITVRNQGAGEVNGLQVSQSMPVGLKFRSADSDGTAGAGIVTWVLDLGATSSATMHTTATVVKTPKQLLRLATVACARTSESAPPTVCASHSDLLPAGAVAAALAASTRSPSSSGWMGHALLVAAIAAIIIAAGVLAARWAHARALARNSGTRVSRR